MGLLAAGVGTMVFLRNAQIASLDAYLRQVVTTNVASALFTVQQKNGSATFVQDAAAPQTQYFVALYDPEGNLVATAGGAPGPVPVYPAQQSLQDTVTRGTDPFELHSKDGSVTFHAAVDVPVIPGMRDGYTQLIAMPLTSVNRTVTSFIGIYSVLMLLTIIGGALLTRWLVTLTFRGLGQVETTALAIARGEFGQRLSDIAPGTEVGSLKTAINAMLDRLDRTIAQRDGTVTQMRRFVGDASHELRTPLVTVRGYAELYRMGAISSDEQVSQAMERIEKEALRMGELVEDLLALARLDERRDIAITEVDLRPIGRDAALDLRATAPDREVAFHDLTEDAPAPAPLTRPITPPSAPAVRRPSPLTAATRTLLRRRPRSGEPVRPVEEAAAPPEPLPSAPAEPIVLGEENRIRQVVANIAANARRYTNDSSPLEIAVGVDEARQLGWIAVVDHGEGIPPQLREKIFQRFWRADTSRTRETGGSGLGLSIVASIVEALGGTIQVADTPGGGATFRVGFPLAERRTAAEHEFLPTQPLNPVRDTGA